MSTLRLTTISNQSGSSSVPSDTVISGSAKAWVNFNGTGTVAIRASFNVSSITDNGTGIYTVNFATAMPDVNYAAAISGGSNNTTVMTVYETTFSNRTISSIQVATVGTASSAVFDSNSVNVAIFR